jgi:hypothetical protein
MNNIFVVSGGQVFEQSVGISMGRNCAPLLADLFCIHMRRNLFRSFYIEKYLLPWPLIRYIDDPFID